jgi:phosphatidylserine decarboxylase
MTFRSLTGRLTENESLNFVATNRIPRKFITRLVGRISKIEQPVVRNVSIALWKFFSDLDLSEAKEQKFKSMHDCFTRQLKDGARMIDQDAAALSSPCDAIVGACGEIVDSTLVQAKGHTYSLQELLIDQDLADHYRDGVFVTLRLTSSMYHRFHAPYDCRVEQVKYVTGDVWNVNPAAVKRVDKLFCKNERAVIRSKLPDGSVVTLVPVAAILVASIRLHFANVLLHLKYRGPNEIPCDAKLRKGEEMGWFEHGSTIIVLAPRGFSLAKAIESGARIKMGQALMRLAASDAQPKLQD